MRNMIKNKKLQLNIVTLLLLCLGLCITSFAISYTIIKIENNTFQTGGIDIDLNGNAPIIPECQMAPGMTVEKEFYIKNNGGWAVFYKLYFEGRSIQPALAVRSRNEKVLADVVLHASHQSQGVWGL